MVAILLSTFNGEKYLREQIDSILNQSYTDWKLYIRDDLSTDNTVHIIHEYLNQYPKKIYMINNWGKNIGPDRKSTRLNSSHCSVSRMPSFA